MRLREYLADKPHGELTRLAKASDVHYTTLWKIVHRGYRLQDYSKAKAVSLATSGAVTVADLCEVDSVPPPPATGTDG